MSHRQVKAPGGALVIPVLGDWREEQTEILTVPSTWRTHPAIQELIEEAWRAKEKTAARLFDGSICRFEAVDATPSRLTLHLSRTSYKVFLGTNLSHPELGQCYGPQFLANPVGVSVSLRSSDGFLIFGRRNESVAYYPSRIHPFAGAMEPRDGGRSFAAVRRELEEEARLTADDLPSIRCLGLVEDLRVVQPELIFRADASRTRADIESRLDRDEHHDTWSIPATQPAVANALIEPALTPVAIGCLLLWGRTEWGDSWMEQAIGDINRTTPPSAPA